MTTRGLFIWLFMLGAVNVSAQDSTAVDTKAKRDSARLARKSFEQENYIKLPYIGIGGGVLNYFGELDHNGRANPFVNSYGFNVSIIQNISPSFGLKFEYSHARLTVNKEDGAWNNFRTDLNAGQVQIFYNFARILPQNRILNPFIAIGVGTFNFNSKADLKSKEGYFYNQHSDGSFWSEAEDSDDIGVELTRDHVYESDLREQNLDGLGKYSQFAFTVPATFGLNFKISNRANLQLASTFHWTSTDLIDNISSKGEGDRKGNAQNDFILYNSISFFYDFLSPKRQKKTAYDAMAFFTLDGDSDGDGVKDVEDLCPGTPKGAIVSEIGCALDGDEDGIPDGIDKEPTTLSNLPVDEKGVGIKDGLKPTIAADSVATKREVRYIVYPDLAEMYQVGTSRKSGSQQPSDLKDFTRFDLDRNGVLSIEEVHTAIDRFFDGELPDLSPADLAGLIDHFFDQ